MELFLCHLGDLMSKGNGYSKELKNLIEDFSDAIEKGDASIFIGSGISAGLKAPDWKNLLKKACDDLDIDDINKTSIPYPDIAQYWIDKADKNRSLLETNIKKILSNSPDKFDLEDSVYGQICHLNIKHIWTTNYDKIIEKAYKDLTNKRPEVLTNDQQILKLDSTRDVFIYKMHGSLENTDEIIITSDDYFTYNEKCPVFSQVLEYDLMTKVMLFIGFSFDDPNINNILQSLQEKIKKVNQRTISSHGRFFLLLYSRSNQTPEQQRLEDYRIKSLEKLNVETIKVLPEKNSIKDILITIRKKTNCKNIVIAGSNKQSWKGLTKLSKELGKRLMMDVVPFNLHTCYGKGVGRDTIQGALEQCSDDLVKDPHNRIKIWSTLERPKSIETDNNHEKKKKFIDDQRLKMINNAAVCIFMGGRNGTLEEFKIALKHNKFCIPVGATGGVTKQEILPLFYQGYENMCDNNQISYDRRKDILESIKEMENIEMSEPEQTIFLLDYIIDIIHCYYQSTELLN